MSEFAERFWTPYSEVSTVKGDTLKSSEVIGRKFIVIGEVDKSTYDFEEVGTMYTVELDGAIVISAYPEEVIKELQAAHGMKGDCA